MDLEREKWCFIISKLKELLKDGKEVFVELKSINV